MAHQGVVLSVKETHPVQVKGCLTPKPRGWKYQSVKMARAKKIWELKPEAFAAGMGYREHLIH